MAARQCETVPSEFECVAIPERKILMKNDSAAREKLCSMVDVTMPASTNSAIQP